MKDNYFNKILKCLFALVLIIFFWQLFRFSYINFPSIRRSFISEDSTTQKESNNASEENLSPILVSVYYESLCPDSKSFIMRQLLPTFNAIPKLMNIEMIPFGKAKVKRTDSSFEFECQHGKIECDANIIHSCAVKHIPNISDQIKYISCMISDNIKPAYIANKCAEELGLDYSTIQKCSISEEGKVLLKQNGDKTVALQPEISFVPTVTLNHFYDDKTLKATLKNLKKEICSLYQNHTIPNCL